LQWRIGLMGVRRISFGRLRANKNYSIAQTAAEASHKVVPHLCFMLPRD
jgi:hypothetical protein